jgi:hypothetical protein
MVAAAPFLADPGDLLQRAARVAQTARDREVVAIAVAHVAGAANRVDGVARATSPTIPTGVLVARSHGPNFGKPLDCVPSSQADGGAPWRRCLRRDFVRAVVESGEVCRAMRC